MIIDIPSRPPAARRCDLPRRWLAAAVLGLLPFPALATVHAGDAVPEAAPHAPADDAAIVPARSNPDGTADDRQNLRPSRKSRAAAAAITSTLGQAAPSPQDAPPQDLYVDSSDPAQPGETYVGPTDALSSGAISYDNEFIGFYGSGTFNQTGGTNTIGGTLFLGMRQGSNGTYNLSDTFTVSIEKSGRAGTFIPEQTDNGNTLTAGAEDIGYGGTGTFNQSGGTNTVNSVLYVGPAQPYGGNGTYNLSGGTLSAYNEGVGTFEAGSFNQSGGINTIHNGLQVGEVGSGENATYGLSGTGALSADTEQISPIDTGTDTFVQTGGTNTVGTTFYLGTSSHNNNDLNGTATYALSGTGALSAPTEEVGTGGAALFAQSGGTNTVSGTLFLGYTLGYTAGSLDTSTYNLSGGGTLSAATEEVGYGSTGAFIQSGGSNTVSGTLYVGSVDPQNSPGPGTYSLSGGTLSAANEYVADGATGTFTQSGGTNTVSGALYLGSTSNSLSGPGTYSLSAGTLSTANEYVADGATGTFTQSGGTNTVSSTLYIGNTSNGVSGPGMYNLSGTGALSAANEYVADGATATFTQSGGTNTTQSLYLAYSGNGTYSLSGGALSASTEYLGPSPGTTATFIQSGGTNTASSAFYLGFIGGSGTYTLSGTGALSAPSEYIGGNASVFTQNGGTNTITNANGAVLFGGIFGGGTGTYNLNGGTLETHAVALNTSGGGPGMGSPPMGTFNFNGGTLQATAANTAFMTGLTAANVQAGGAIIDSNGYAITVGQPLRGGVSGGQDGGLTKRGTGTLTLTGVSTFNGPTVLNAGALALNAAGSPALGGTNAVTVNAGSTLSLGAANQINPAATLILNANSGPSAGATVAFNTGGYSQTLGALTLSSSSVIDLGNGASVLRLGNSAGNWTGTLAIWNWTGASITGGGGDEMFFGGNTSGLTEAQVLDIHFYSDSGTTLLGTAGYAFSDDGEVVPGGLLPGTGVAIPEPATWFAGAGLSGLMLLRYRRRIDVV